MTIPSARMEASLEIGGAITEEDHSAGESVLSLSFVKLELSRFPHFQLRLDSLVLSSKMENENGSWQKNTYGCYPVCGGGGGGWGGGYIWL